MSESTIHERGSGDGDSNLNARKVDQRRAKENFSEATVSTSASGREVSNSTLSREMMWVVEK